jgi:actin-related protein
MLAHLRYWCYVLFFFLFVLSLQSPHSVAREEAAEKLRLEQASQIQMHVERLRAAEVLFHPSSVGIDQVGITECLARLLRRLDPVSTQRAVKNVFLCGGTSQLGKFHTRLWNEVRSILPEDVQFQVHRAQDPVLDPWFGAREFCMRYVCKEK